MGFICTFTPLTRRCARGLLAALVWSVLAWLAAAPAGAQALLPEVHGAQALRMQRDGMQEALRTSKFHVPLRLDSGEPPGGVRGDVYADMDADFDSVVRALSDVHHWCDVLLLHVNNRQCRITGTAASPTLVLGIVRKYDHAPDQAMRLALSHKVVAATSEYLEVQLSSPDGPLGTSNFHIVVQAVPLPGKHTFLHFMNAYDAGMIANLATKTFLATFSSGKVGFTVAGKQPDGQPQYIAGVRGLMERNVARYFLGIEAYVSAMHLPAPEQFDKRLDHWANAADHYPRQLHEVDRATYLALKRADHVRDNSSWH